MLITVRGRLVRSHGVNDLALPGAGVIQYQPATHGTHEGALRGVDPVPARIVDGEAEPVELTPGPWRISVFPEYGDAWEPYLVELTEDMTEPVELVDLTPVVEIDGEKWVTGPRGISVTGLRDNGDGTVTWLYSDGTESEPYEIGVGPAGRGIVSVSDPDEDSLVTITYTDGSTSTVQAITGAQGDTGPAPTITWDGTTIIVDGETGPDLQGAAGASAWEDVTGKPSEFPPSAHGHTGGEVTVDLGDGETTVQDAYETLTADTATARSEAAAAHTLADGKADAAHTHALEDVTGLGDALSDLSGSVSGVEDRTGALESRVGDVEGAVSSLESTLGDVRAYAVEFPHNADWYMGQSPTRIIVTPVEGGRFCTARARIQNRDARLDLPRQEWVIVPATPIPPELRKGDTDYIEVRLPQGDERGLIEMAYSINRVRIKSLGSDIAWTTNGSIWFDMSWFVPDE